MAFGRRGLALSVRRPPYPGFGGRSSRSYGLYGDARLEAVRKVKDIAVEVLVETIESGEA